jgi:hypothetical protein
MYYSGFTPPVEEVSDESGEESGREEGKAGRKRIIQPLSLRFQKHMISPKQARKAKIVHSRLHNDDAEKGRLQQSGKAQLSNDFMGSIQDHVADESNQVLLDPEIRLSVAHEKLAKLMQIQKELEDMQRNLDKQRSALFSGNPSPAEKRNGTQTPPFRDADVTLQRLHDSRLMQNDARVIGSWQPNFYMFIYFGFIRECANERMYVCL